VGINDTGADPHPSAGLDVNFNNKGLLPPRMTVLERNAIVSPAAGLTIYNTTSGCINIYSGTIWREVCPTTPTANISSLNCAGATNNGTLTSGVAASGVNSVISYTGGNGESYSGQTVTSTGVTGLTATLSPGIIALGGGTIIYEIAGTPSANGTASFSLNIGGQSCSLNITVNSPPFVCGSNNVTFTYKGSSVTYGTVTGANGSCWLDRNLGAAQVATSSADDLSYGDLFQWGRGDDGHQSITWSNSITGTPVNSNQNGTSTSTTPGNFFLYGFENWYTGSTPSPDNLWQGVSGVNNPCPSGWRVPTYAEFDAERSSWGSNNATGAFNSPLKLPVAGARLGGNPAALILAGSEGLYWSSSVTSTNSLNLKINSSTASIDPNNRAVGLSVRCIKD
jgi:hypothetical protein